MADSIVAVPVEVLGCPVGNLWDIFKDGEKMARVTYHGDKLVCLKGGLFASRAKVERAIEALYN